jgi:hypothetical protein
VEDELEIRFPGEVGDVVGGSGQEIVHGDDPVTLCKQPVAQMRAEEPRAAGHERTLLQYDLRLE